MTLTSEQIKAAADRAEARSKAATVGADDTGLDSKDYEFKLGDETADEVLARSGDVDVLEIHWPVTTSKNNDKPVKDSMVNVRAALTALKLKLRFDVFTGAYNVEGEGLGKFTGELNDKIARKVRELIYKRTKFEPGKDAVFEGLQRACEENQFNSIRDYLDGLNWDGVPRLDKWLTTYLGVNDTALHGAWGRLLLMAAVRRVYDPGCQFQHVLVLEGPEGTIKSTTVKVLACGQAGRRPKYFSDSSILDRTEKEQMELCLGVWFYEIAELAGMRKAEQYKVKRFITAEEERARPAYGHFKENQPRIAIFIGTFNTDADTGEIIEYLNPGDRRRWWPVLVGVIDIESLIRDRDQLFAEAKAMVMPQFDWEDWASLTLDPSLWAAAAEVQKAREITNPLAERLALLHRSLQEDPVFDNGAVLVVREDYIVSLHGDGFTPQPYVWIGNHALRKVLGHGADPSGRSLPAAMRSLGWRQVRDRRSGDVVRGWVKVLDDPEAVED